MDQDHPSTIQLAAFLDRELAIPESSRLSDHLERCSLCRDYVQGLQDTSDSLAFYVLPPGLGDATRERVLEALPDRRTGRRSSGLLPWLPSAALAATNIGVQAVFAVALVITALSLFGVLDIGGILIAGLPTDLPAAAASVGQVAGDVLGWLTFGSLGPAFRSLMDSAGIDATTLLTWLVPIAVALGISISLGLGFVGWLAVAWGVETRNRDRSLRTT